MTRLDLLRHRREALHEDGDDRGAVVVLVAVGMLTLLIVSALVIDIGYAKQSRRLAQNSADAAALAAAQELDGYEVSLRDAVDKAKEWARKNDDQLTDASWVGCRDPQALPRKPDTDNTCISFSDDYLTVRVQLPPLTQPSFFGGAVTPDPLTVNASAVATRRIARGTPAGCGLCVVGPDGSLNAGGPVGIRVEHGDVRTHGMFLNDSVRFIEPVPVGWRDWGSSNWGRNVDPNFESRIKKLDADVPNPFDGRTVSYENLALDGTNVNYNGTGSPLQPNRIYTQNVNINSGTLTLAPGTYYFANTLIVNSGATLIGNDVTLVFSCQSACTPSGGEPGKFNFASGSTVKITAPSSGHYAGMAIMFDPNGRQGTPNQLSGNVDLEGAIYGRRAGFNMGSSSGVIKAWTVVVGGRFDANQGTLLIDNSKMSSGGGGSAGGVPGSISLVG